MCVFLVFFEGEFSFIFKIYFSFFVRSPFGQLSAQKLFIKIFYDISSKVFDVNWENLSNEPNFIFFVSVRIPFI